MKSNICKIRQGKKDLAAILKESEKVAMYNDLTHKQAMHLRLICEEIDGMLPELVGNFEGDFWIDFIDGVCKVNISIEIEDINTEHKNQLIKIAKSKRNAAIVGITGKIRAAIENFCLDIDSIGAFAMREYGVEAIPVQNMDVTYAHYWSLNQYKNNAKQNFSAEQWDELEKSVIASVADDIVVGVKGNKASIVIYKYFNKKEN